MFVLLVGTIIGGFYVKTALPNVVDAPNIQIQKTSGLIARGKYLAHHVAVCMDCNSTRKWDHYSSPMDVNA